MSPHFISIAADSAYKHHVIYYDAEKNELVVHTAPVIGFWTRSETAELEPVSLLNYSDLHHLTSVDGYRTWLVLEAPSGLCTAEDAFVKSSFAEMKLTLLKEARSTENTTDERAESKKRIRTVDRD